MAIRGGKRNGAGRPKGARNKRTRALSEATAEASILAQDGESPLAFLLQVMRDETKEPMVRLDAAKAAAPYQHARLSSIDLHGKLDTTTRVKFERVGHSS